MKHLERDGLIRHLRINNGEDIVPAIPPISFFRKRLMKHTGINLRFEFWGYSLQHTSRANLWSAVGNSMFKPVFLLNYFHSLSLHLLRLDEHANELKAMSLDDLYKDDTVVSSDFIDGKIISYKEE